MEPTPLPVHAHTKGGGHVEHGGRGRIQREYAGGEGGGARTLRLHSLLPLLPSHSPSACREWKGGTQANGGLQG